MLNRTTQYCQLIDLHTVSESAYRSQKRFCHKSCTSVQLQLVSTTFSISIQDRLTKSFISDISLSTSSMNCIMKSTNLCFNISSVWKFVIKNEISYPYHRQSQTFLLTQHKPTLIGFLRRIKNASALCVKNLVNLCTRMFSISSACLILMLIRTLFMLGSMRTRSFSFRATVRGFRRTSGEVWASISGTLWRSEVWDAKLERQRAEVRLERTHWRYGRSD